MGAIWELSGSSLGALWDLIAVAGMLCQETFNNLDQSHAIIAACASCCERLLSANGQQGFDEIKKIICHQSFF
jgi:hypothetical protein